MSLEAKPKLFNCENFSQFPLEDLFIAENEGESGLTIHPTVQGTYPAE
jgi:hypothetical protein